MSKSDLTVLAKINSDHDVRKLALDYGYENKDIKL